MRLMERLGLSDDELCAVLAVDPIAVITGELDHRPELAILLAQTAEALRAASAPTSCAAGCAPPAPPAARSTTCWRATSPPSSMRSKRCSSAGFVVGGWPGAD